MADTTQKSKTIKLFQENRKGISKEIYNNVANMVDFNQLSDVHTNALSLRQRLLEDNHMLLENFTNLKKKYRVKKGHLLEEMSKNHQTFYKHGEKGVILDGKTADIRELMDIFENQINFYSESIRTVDNIIFGIKSRIDVQKILGL